MRCLGDAGEFEGKTMEIYQKNVLLVVKYPKRLGIQER